MFNLVLSAKIKTEKVGKAQGAYFNKEVLNPNHRAFIMHLRDNVKDLAENLNFGSWEVANAINQSFNESVLNNSEFQKTILPMFNQKIQESIQSVEVGSELATLGYKLYATIDLTNFNYRFTMTDDMTGFDVEEADDFEIIINGFNLMTGEMESGLGKLTLKAGGRTYKRLLGRLSTSDMAVVALIPETFEFALSSRPTGEWRDNYKGSFRNASKNANPDRLILDQNDGFSVNGTMTSSISDAVGKPGDTSSITFAIDADRKARKGAATVGFEHNGRKIIDLDLKETLGENGGFTTIDFTQFASGSSIFDVLGVLWSGRSIDEGTVTLLDDLTIKLSVTDLANAAKVARDCREARRHSADEQTIDDYAKQMNQIVTSSVTLKGSNQIIPMRFQTTKFGLDYWSMPAFNFGDPDGFVPASEVLDNETMTYAINIVDHAIDPMAESVITLRQLLQFVQTYLAPMQQQQKGSSFVSE